MTTHDQHTEKIISAAKKHPGSCHCGAVRFEVELDESKGGSRCNCSICTKINMTGTVVKPDAFTLLAGQDSLSEYVWGGRTGTRFFCKHCGVHCFGRGYLEQLGGDYVSVSLNAVDDVDTSKVNVIYWDGRHDNWEAGPRNAPWPISASGDKVP